MNKIKFLLMFTLSLIVMFVAIVGVGDRVVKLATFECERHYLMMNISHEDSVAMINLKCPDFLFVSDNRFVQSAYDGLFLMNRICKETLHTIAYASIPILTFLIPTLLAYCFGIDSHKYSHK